MHGNPADMVEIMKIANQYNIPVIEDSAQCVLGYIGKDLVGTFGDMASWSFETRNISQPERVEWLRPIATNMV